MLWPKVTELPRRLEPATRDTFVRDLDARSLPRRAADPRPPDPPARTGRE